MRKGGAQLDAILTSTVNVRSMASRATTLLGGAHEHSLWPGDAALALGKARNIVRVAADHPRWRDERSVTEDESR